ncbi:MAG: hypothetical protein ACREBD_04275, partial [Blastocatellia bacterium]
MLAAKTARAGNGLQAASLNRNRQGWYIDWQEAFSIFHFQFSIFCSGPWLVMNWPPAKNGELKMEN